MKSIVLAMAAALMILPVSIASAQDAACGCTSTSECCGKSCTKVRCSSCGKSCVPEIVQTDKTKDCYQVGCKDICIPKVTFPWQKCCGPQCGKVKSVRVLKKVEYKCPSCEYKWTVVGNGCGDCGQGACGCESETAPVPPTASVPAAQPTVKSQNIRIKRIPSIDSKLERPPVPQPVVIQQTKYYR